MGKTWRKPWGKDHEHIDRWRLFFWPPPYFGPLTCTVCTLLDVSWLLGEITSLEMAGKQVVGERKIWVMFLLEESLPCVQPLLYLVWKKTSVILHGSTVIIVCFFWDEAKPGGSGIHTELIFYTCTQISTFGRFGHQPHCLSTVLSIQGQNVTLARYMFCCKQRDILQPSCTCSPSINRTIEFNT